MKMSESSRAIDKKLSVNNNQKSEMARDIARELGMKFVTVDCNLLKEGEIGGLPIPVKDGNGKVTTKYALHPSIRKIDDYNKEEDVKVLLFLDELNRSERAVHSELMNIILNKEINGYTLSDNVFILAAMNPAGNAYATTEMDPASKNRLVWLDLDVDSKIWLDWATGVPVKKEEEKEALKITIPDFTSYDTIIDGRITEFIVSNPNLLNQPSESEDVSPSCRTWSFVSDIIRTYDANKTIFEDQHLQAAIKGCVGNESYIAFTTFLNNNTNPLIKPEELFKGKTVAPELLNKFKSDTVPRQMIMTKSVNTYLANASKLSKDDVAKLISIYELLPADILVICMRHIKEQYKPLFDKLLKQSTFVDLFISVQNSIKL